MRKYICCIVCSLLITISNVSHAVDGTPSFDVGGYIRNFTVITDTDDDTEIEDLARLRLELDARPNESLTFEFAYELVPLGKSYTEEFVPLLHIVPSPGPKAYRVDDIDEQLYPEDHDEESHFILLQNLDRAVIAFSQESFDLYIGRQAVAFGSARVINPLDIIAPFTYNTLAKEERIGVDAVRVKTPLGRLGEIDIGYVFGNDFEEKKSAAFIRTKFYIAKTDLTLMGMRFRENHLIGLNVVRSIGGAGTWLEAGYVFSKEKSDEDYLRVSTGADYSFTDDLYTYIEYHYNDAGKNRPEDYPKVVGTTAYTDGSVYLLARHYITPGFTYTATPLLTFNGNALVNLIDGSFILSPSFEYSLSDNANMQLGAFIGVGEESNSPFDIKSEFGLYPDLYFLSLNYYF